MAPRRDKKKFSPPPATPSTSGYIPPPKSTSKNEKAKNNSIDIVRNPPSATNGFTVPTTNGIKPFRNSNRVSIASYASSAGSAPANLNSKKQSSFSSLSDKGDGNKKYYTSRSLDVVQENTTYSKCWEINKKGSSKNELREPTDVCFLIGDQLAVAEKMNSRIQIFDKTGRSKVVIDKNVESTFSSPTCLDTNRKRNMLYVLDRNQIYYIDLITHNPVDYISIYGVTDLHGLCTDKNDNLIITNLGLQPGVMIYDIVAENPKTRLIPKFDQFRCPSYVQVCPVTGRIFISDSMNHCIFIFDKQGQYLNTIGNKRGNTANYLTWPCGIATNRFGEVMVADRGNNRVACFDGDGRFKYHPITEKDGLKGPVGVALYDSTLAVTSHSMGFKFDNYSVQLYQGQE